MTTTSPERQLASFLAKYDPAVAARAKAAVEKMCAILSGANRLVYDNYNALAIGFGWSDRASEIVLSIALYPRWVSLFFVRGAELTDPEKLLKGSGKTIRHIVLGDASDLDKPAIRKLIAQAVKLSEMKSAPAEAKLIIKSVSPKQRPRRPSAPRTTSA